MIRPLVCERALRVALDVDVGAVAGEPQIVTRGRGDRRPTPGGARQPVTVICAGNRVWECRPADGVSRGTNSPNRCPSVKEQSQKQRLESHRGRSGALRTDVKDPRGLITDARAREWSLPHGAMSAQSGVCLWSCIPGVGPRSIMGMMILSTGLHFVHGRGQNTPGARSVGWHPAPTRRSRICAGGNPGMGAG